MASHRQAHTIVLERIPKSMLLGLSSLGRFAMVVMMPDGLQTTAIQAVEQKSQLQIASTFEPVCSRAVLSRQLRLTYVLC